MSIKSKVFAAVAALTLVTGAAAAGATSASAATPSCGGSCVDLFSWQFGNFFHPNFVLDVFQQGQKVGQPAILFRESNSDPAEDVSAEFNGTTSNFYAAGLVSSEVALHYGCTVGATVNVAGAQIVCGADAVDDPAFEAEYAPYGVDSGLCFGLASTAVQGEKVTLQPCGETSKTVWIVDTTDAVITSAGVPLINGSDTNFSHPFVLTYPADAYPTDKPRASLEVTNITGSTNGSGGPILGTVDSSQLWSADIGVLP